MEKHSTPDSLEILYFELVNKNSEKEKRNYFGKNL